MTRYIKLELTSSSQAEREMLIALLAEKGFEGFEEADDIFRAYIPESAFDEALLVDMTLPPYQLETVEPRNWNADWEAGFSPVEVENFCAIRADFHAPILHVQHEIIITPKMSFGTGHHATTYMMIRHLKEIAMVGACVLDFGTGTGILAILAEKMGATEVVAIDHDEYSIRNATENLEQNSCQHVSLLLDDKVELQNQFDVILANILLPVILKNLPGLTKHLKEGGVLLVSGLLADDEPKMTAAAGEFGMVLTDRMQKENWLSLKFEYQKVIVD